MSLRDVAYVWMSTYKMTVAEVIDYVLDEPAIVAYANPLKYREREVHISITIARV